MDLQRIVEIETRDERLFGKENGTTILSAQIVGAPQLRFWKRSPTTDEFEATDWQNMVSHDIPPGANAYIQGPYLNFQAPVGKKVPARACLVQYACIDSASYERLTRT